MTANSVRLGPGSFSLGETTALQDASCQLSNGVVAWSKDADDPIHVLCGDVVAGAVKYTATFGGTMLQDLIADGIVEYTWENKGATVPFTFVPNDVNGTSVTGNLVVDPLDVGATDDYGTVMASDFEWDIVGEPILTIGGTGGGALDGQLEGAAA